MLLGEEKEPFDDPEYIYELKLDGIRCIAYLEKGKAALRNKRNKDVTDIYPELSEIWRKLIRHSLSIILSRRRAWRTIWNAVHVFIRSI